MMIHKKKIAAMLSALLLATTPCFAANTSDILSAVTALMSAQQAGSGSNKMQSLLSAAMLMNGGISLTDGIKYSWIDSGEVKSFVQCSLSTTRPEINQEVEAVCSILISDKKYTATPMPLQMKQTFTSAGKASMNGMFIIYKTAEEKEDGRLVQTGGTQAGTTFVTINIDDVYDSATVLANSPENPDNWKTATDPVTGEQVNTVSGRAPDISEAIDNNKYYQGYLPSLVDDGTNSDPLPAPTSNGTIINVPEGYGSDPDSPTNNGGGLPDIGNNTDREKQAIDDILNGSNLNGNTSTNNGSNIADYLNRALDDLGAFNSGEDDWKGSNTGNDGESSLDDYFGGVDEEDSDAPGGLTDDVLGLGTSIYDDEESNQNPQQEYAVVEDLPTGEGDSDDGSIVVAENDDSQQQTDEYGLTDLASIYQQGLAGLDSLPNSNGDSSNGGLLGSMSARDGSSLGRRLQRLAGGDVSVVNNVSATASDQELFDLAKKELTGAGISLEDIKRGLTYSPNSAWTDPAIAWDFNRITTLMKKKKISLQPSASQRSQEHARNNAKSK